MHLKPICRRGTMASHTYSIATAENPSVFSVLAQIHVHILCRWSIEVTCWCAFYRFPLKQCMMMTMIRASKLVFINFEFNAYGAIILMMLQKREFGKNINQFVAFSICVHHTIQTTFILTVSSNIADCLYYGYRQ